MSDLHDMEADRTEGHDLGTRYPERIREMVARWEAWATQNEVLPWLWKPAYGETADKTK